MTSYVDKVLVYDSGRAKEIDSGDTITVTTGLASEQVTVLNTASPPAANGQIRYVTGTGFEFYEEGLIKTLSGTGGGISAGEHKTLLQLIHFIDEGPADGFTTGATKTVTGGAFPTSILWRRADTTKLVEQVVTWTGILPTTVEWKLYGTDGTTVVATVTDTITYSGPFEASRTRAIA